MQDEPVSSAPRDDHLLQVTTDIVASFVSNNPVTSEALPDVIRSVYRTILALSGPGEPRPDERLKPAVPISKSVSNDHIICLEDGKKLKMLKRYLRSKYDLSPDEYRRRWGLPADYPMVAPSYTQRRSEFAKKIGLGKGVRKGR
jgi:predicted transcriptional regulator